MVGNSAMLYMACLIQRLKTTGLPIQSIRLMLIMTLIVMVGMAGLRLTHLLLRESGRTGNSRHQEV